MIAPQRVSGEYAMIKAAAVNGWAVLETLTAIERARADVLITTTLTKRHSG